MKIIISGPTAAFDDKNKPLSKQAELKKLDGIVYDKDSCCKHLSRKLEEIGLKGGLLALSYQTDTKSLRVVTEYRSPRKLRPGELKALAKETTGQWSDGIGESPFWSEVRPGVRIDLFPSAADKDLHIEQIDDGVKVAPKRFSPLVKAVETGDIEKIKKLLAKGEDINSRDKRGRPLLLVAIWKGQLDAASFLIDQGVDVNAADLCESDHTRQTALHLICWVSNRSLALTKALLEKGANVNAVDSWGRTPLFSADLDQSRLLIEYGANVNHRDTKKHNEGHTAYMSAGDQARIDFLIEQGADVNNRNCRGLTAYEYALFQAGELPGTSQYERWMPIAQLHLAALRARATAGDPASLYTVAEYFDRGLGGPQDAKQAFREFERAAKGGYRLALVRLGLFYRDGKAVAANLKKALGYFRQAAEAGVPIAMGILGNCYAEGKGVETDPVQAMAWFRRGAEIDPEQAQPSEIYSFRNGVGACRAELGACFEEGKGVAKDVREALRWYQAALDVGFHHVQPAIDRLQA